MNEITITIPTFERGDAVISCIQNILDQPNGDKTLILVSDNGSRDGSWEKLTDAFAEKENVELLCNTENKGFQSNFLKLLESSRTKYSFLISDEDQVDLQAFETLVQYVAKNPETAFISSAQIMDGKVYRGKNKITDLALKEFKDCSNYISGLVFDNEIARQCIHDIGREEFLQEGQVYPQCIIVAGILAQGHKAIWHPASVSKKAFDLPSRIDDSSKTVTYGSLEGRALQVRLFEATFAKMRDLTRGSEVSKRWEKIRSAWMEYALTHIRYGWSVQYPKDLKTFDKSMKHYSFVSKCLRKVESKFKQILGNR